MSRSFAMEMNRTSTNNLLLLCCCCSFISCSNTHNAATDTSSNMSV